jgi:hypothetical protein
MRINPVHANDMPRIVNFSRLFRRLLEKSLTIRQLLSRDSTLRQTSVKVAAGDHALYRLPSRARASGGDDTKRATYEPSIALARHETDPLERFQGAPTHLLGQARDLSCLSDPHGVTRAHRQQHRLQTLETFVGVAFQERHRMCCTLELPATLMPTRSRFDLLNSSSDLAWAAKCAGQLNRSDLRRRYEFPATPDATAPSSGCDHPPRLTTRRIFGKPFAPAHIER